MKSIVVGSRNPVKIACVRDAWQRLFSEPVTVVGLAAQSSVSEQPMSDIETYQGAMHRATDAAQSQPEADFWVGVEGGVELWQGDMMAFAWIVVIDAFGNIGKARTASFELPQEVQKLVASGLELGLADDQVFGKQNSKQQSGAVGLLTHDIIDRQTYYAHAAMLAFIPFLNPAWYPTGTTGKSN
jgi:inosine/xanthosine triphosphatase